MMPEMDPREYVYIKHKVLRMTGIDLACYKTPQVQRRLKTYLVRSGYPNWHLFFRAVADDPAALAKFRDYLTINVSSFFRDEDKYRTLEENILPELVQGHPRLRVWSAGCSHGHEPYSLAMLLARATGIYCRHDILATDIDHSALERAEAGGPYTPDEIGKVPSDLLSQYFRVWDGGCYVTENLRRRVRFEVHNLLDDPFGSGLDLIVCRNVAIYFTAEIKARLYRDLHDALRPGGVLFVGSTEVIPRMPEANFEWLETSFYRRRETE